MQATSDSPASNLVDTFVASKGRIVVGLFACVLFWLIGFALSRRLLGNNAGDWVTIGYGFLLTLMAGFMIRHLIYLMAMRVVINADAIGFFWRGRMTFIPWGEVQSIRAKSPGFIYLKTAAKTHFFNVDVFRRSALLKSALHRQCERHGISWVGRYPIAPKLSDAPRERPLVRLIGGFWVALAWFSLLIAIPSLSDVGIENPFWIIVVCFIVSVGWLILSMAFPKVYWRRPFVKWWLRSREKINWSIRFCYHGPLFQSCVRQNRLDFFG
jgi:hypothetical protein